MKILHRQSLRPTTSIDTQLWHIFTALFSLQQCHHLHQISAANTASATASAHTPARHSPGNE
ncbi:MAG TPA: hypothetical protein VFN30_15605 [Chitinophagaceae bacterium]|nr:hypothetical protein [Chitinophagaceae bacterium]